MSTTQLYNLFNVCPTIVALHFNVFTNTGTIIATIEHRTKLTRQSYRTEIIHDPQAASASYAIENLQLNINQRISIPPNNLWYTSNPL